MIEAIREFFQLMTEDARGKWTLVGIAIYVLAIVFMLRMVQIKKGITWCGYADDHGREIGFRKDNTVVWRQQKSLMLRPLEEKQ